MVNLDEVERLFPYRRSSPLLKAIHNIVEVEVAQTAQEITGQPAAVPASTINKDFLRILGYFRLIPRFQFLNRNKLSP